MAKMRAVDAAMYVLEKEGITTAFGVPGLQSTPSILQCVSMEVFAIYWRVMWKALRIWLRATRAAAGNIGVCRHFRPGGNRHDHRALFRFCRLYPDFMHYRSGATSASAQGRFRAVDIEAIAKPVSKMAVTVREAALVPRVLQQAFHLMRSGRPVLCWLIYRLMSGLRRSNSIRICMSRCRYISQPPAAYRLKRRWRC